MGWKIYFWFFLFLVVVSSISIFVRKELLLIHTMDLAISCPSLAGLFCFAYKKKWLSASFWRTYFFIYLAWDLIFNIFIMPHLETANYSMRDTILGLAITLPLYIGLYLYAFKFRESPSGV